MTKSRSKAILELGELIDVPLNKPYLYEKLGVSPPKGILLYGPSGIGKSYLIKQAAEKAKAEFKAINIEGISGNNFVKTLSRTVDSEKPQVLYLVMHNPEYITKELITTLGKLFDNDLEIDLSRTIITGSSVKPVLPNELTRPGRFDREIYVPFPDVKERAKIMREMTVDARLSESVDLENIAHITQGYTPADLMQLIKTTAQLAIRNHLDNHSEVSENDRLTEITHDDFLKSMKIIEPTLLKEFGFVHSDTTWDDIGGHDYIKEEIWKNVVQPLKFPEYFEKTGIGPISGIILWGPPGNGKTTIAKAIAGEAGARFLYINASELIGVKGGKKRISQLFEVAAQVEPVVLFFDEADALLRDREDATESRIVLVNEFLTNLDGMGRSEKTIIIAATNFIDYIDEAILRPGRLELKLYVAPPKADGRKLAFEYLTKNLKLDSSITLDIMTELTQSVNGKRYSFAELKAIVKEASMISVREAIEAKLTPDDIVTKLDHFQEALQKIHPTVDEDKWT